MTTARLCLLCASSMPDNTKQFPPPQVVFRYTAQSHDWQVLGQTGAEKGGYYYTIYLAASVTSMVFWYLWSSVCAGNPLPVWPPRLSSWHKGWPPPGTCRCFSCSEFSCCQTSWRPGRNQNKTIQDSVHKLSLKWTHFREQLIKPEQQIQTDKRLNHVID